MRILAAHFERRSMTVKIYLIDGRVKTIHNVVCAFENGEVFELMYTDVVKCTKENCKVKLIAMERAVFRNDY